MSHPDNTKDDEEENKDNEDLSLITKNQNYQIKKLKY